MRSTNILVRVRSESLLASARALVAGGGRDLRAVTRWFEDGDVWALVDPAAEGTPMAVAIMTMTGSRLVQIRAVHPVDDHGPRLLAGIADRYRALGVRRITVLISDHELALLDVLLRAEFRITHIEPAACDRARGWMVSEPRDGLWLQLEL